MQRSIIGCILIIFKHNRSIMGDLREHNRQEIQYVPIPRFGVAFIRRITWL